MPISFRHSLKTLTLLLMATTFNVSGMAQTKTAEPQQTPLPSKEASEPKSEITHVFVQAPEDHVIGEAGAPNTLIVYASVTCSHCSKWFSEDYPVLKERLIDEGKLKLVFREFPTHPADIALAGFQLANCAPEEDYFDLILFQLQNQKETFTELEEGRGKERFREIATMSGINTEAEMYQCFENRDGMMRIERSLERAKAGNIQGVPALILNGEIMPGLNGADHVLQALGE